MATTTLGQYTYTTSGSNRVIVTGPGMPRVGGDLGNLSNLSAASFTSLASSPNLSPEAAEAMRLMASSGDWTQVKAGLTEPESKNADPAVEQQENSPGAEQEQTTQQNREYEASGGAQDDNPSENTNDSNTDPNDTGNESSQVSDSSGTTVAGKSDVKGGTSTTAKPNKRQQNPLANFSSYTYQITLYMVTPDAYDLFIESGRRNIAALNQAVTSQGSTNATKQGAYIIAQSGGINNDINARAPGFQYDYYIDDLKIKTSTNAKATQTSSNVTEVTFNITEPYGFSFISNLKRAGDAITKVSKKPNVPQQSNASRQFFIIGLRFLGYDKNGKLITGTEHQPGDPKDPVGNSDAIFETFYDVFITDIKFKIDGKATVYNITAATTAPKVSMGTKFGRTNKDIQIVGTDVYDALMGNSDDKLGLLESMNRQQQAMVGKSIEIANEYAVEFIGDASEIKKALIVSDDDPDKAKWPMKAKSTKYVNDAVSVNAVPNKDLRQIKFKSDTSILQAINLIIGQSTYLSDALNIVRTTDPEGEDVDENKTTTRVKWYNLSSKVQCKGFDTKIGDWAYKITYVIQPYETPVLMSPYVNKAIEYYGPHKRYEYWYTGQNNSIIKYEQTLNNAFFTVALDPKKQGTGQGGPITVPVRPQMLQNQPRTNSLAEGRQSQMSYMTSLYDPEAYAKVDITILGDPDFLVQDSVGSISQVYNPFYGANGYTISANGGQVFIEIDFKEPVDYFNKDGLLSINESIQFWDYPPEIQKKVKGVSYQVIEVTSRFSKGVFTQDLSCIINTFSSFKADPKSSASQREDGSQERAENAKFARQGTGSATNNQGSTTVSNGFKPDAPPPDYTTDYVSPEESYRTNIPTQNETSPKPLPASAGGVQDDDNSGQTIVSPEEIGRGP
jgi:hypothetical protein